MRLLQFISTIMARRPVQQLSLSFALNLKFVMLGQVMKLGKEGNKLTFVSFA